MKVFRHKSGKFYTITRNLVGPCICGKCYSKYTAIESPRGLSPSILHISALDDFEEVGER